MRAEAHEKKCIEIDSQVSGHTGNLLLGANVELANDVNLAKFLKK